MCDNRAALREVLEQPPVNPGWNFAAAESRMKAEFHWSGHTTLKSDEVDKTHELHGLWEETRSHLDKVFLQPETEANRRLDLKKMQDLYQHIWARGRAAAEAYHARGDYKAQLPLKSEVLTLRFALPPHQANSHVTYAVNMLAACHAMWLFQVADTDPAAAAATRDAAQRAQRERAAIGRIYQTSREMYEVLELNLRLWMDNKAEVEHHLRRLQARRRQANGGWGYESEEMLFDLAHVENSIEDTLEMMQAAQNRFEEAQKNWWDARQEERLLEGSEPEPASAPEDGRL
ncbi:hypothetical protein ISF_08319 [Cordyceps fumosorosea ARSEF 2679]|uniref:Uncharacterized protein n=1 Tax=Cordyceps fumosorosea (strain ARSEF 2679) TaxID=1081104 RepID=A0A167MI92_CORFA|nr:hypothetical protein ISF_08319 [Cordyceps fumosorosea ARSEF 2679]OAA54391.1 hypothetical protein ISF_08319 [Cordyceps fumosorosea ARSEF 2679]